MFQKNIRSFLSRQGHYIDRKTPPLHPYPVRDNMFSFLHYVPIFVPNDYFAFFDKFS